MCVKCVLCIKKSKEMLSIICVELFRVKRVLHKCVLCKRVLLKYNSAKSFYV